MLSKDAVDRVTAAEEAAKKARAAAQAVAAEQVSSSEKAAEEAVRAGIARAEEELTHLMRAADEKAEGVARDLADNTANRQAAMRVRAGSRLDQAAMLIVERIVNG